MILEYFRNRRSVGWFFGAGLLGLVILAFVALYFPDFMGDPATAAMRRGVAWVDDETIPASDFLERYRQLAQQYQEQTQGQFSATLARQLGLPEQVAADLVRARVLVLEAERHGLRVTDAEVGTAIANSPAFQREGAFIGAAAYLDLLRSARLDPRTFENGVRSDLLSTKLQALVTQSPYVSDLELVEEYRRRNESASVDVWFVSSAARLGDVEITEAEAAAHYDADPSAFELPVQRRIRYFTLSEQTVGEEVTVRQREIQRYYDRNLFQYQMGERAEAAHILLQPESEAEEEATRTLAARLADRAREGEDFAELARAYSADEATAADGGELGVFGPEEMLPEFSEAVFSMQPGEISEPIRTDYGFHVVALHSLEPAETQELTEVQDDIEMRLRREKAAELLTERVLELEQRAPRAGRLEDLLAEHPLVMIQESDFFGEGEVVFELASAEAAAAAFRAGIGDVVGPVRLATGVAFLEVAEERAAHVPEFEGVREDVTSALSGERALGLARTDAEAIRAAAAGGEAPETDPTPLPSWFRGSPLGGAGLVPAAEEMVFGAGAGEIVGPFETERGYAVVRVNEVSGFDEAAFAEQKEPFRAQMAEEKKARIWSAFLAGIEGRYDIRIDRQALNALIG